MIASLTKPEPPTDDKRWKVVDTTMRRNGYADHALIEALHSVQEWFGYIDEPAMRYVARSLNVPLSKVYGVATFYHYFTMRPPGKHACVVCLGTACYIKGAQQLVDQVSERFHVAPGRTSDDGELSLLTARCLGSCGLAPAVVFDGQVEGNLTPEALNQRLDEMVKS